MTTRTIVAWDGPHRSRAALDWAVARSRRTRDGEVVVVAVIADDHPPDAHVPWHDSDLGAAIDDLHSQVERVRDATGIVIEHEVMVGDAVAQLARLSGPDVLLVLGASHRVPGIHPFRAHIASRLVSIASGPVAVIGDVPPDGRFGVVVGVDGSIESDAAVVHGAHEAAGMRQPLVLVHAYTGRAERDLGILNDLESESLSWTAGAHAQLLAQAEELALETEPGLDVERRFARHPAVPSLVATGHRASLLVVGSRAHGRLRGLVPLGTVSTAILVAQPCPIVLIGTNAAAIPPTDRLTRTRGEHHGHL